MFKGEGGTLAESSGLLTPSDERSVTDGGRLASPADGTTGGIPLPALAVRLGGAEALGGGGVPRLGVELLGSFLLTHFLRSVS